MIKQLVIVALLAILVQHLVTLWVNLDFLKHVHSHYPGECRQVKGIGVGSEDMHMLKDGTTFISSGFRMAENQAGFDRYYEENHARGGIFVFDLNDPGEDAREMTIPSTKEFDRERFFPHGISGWEDKKSGKLFLFVVNHGYQDGDRVEKFLVSLDTLTLHHIKAYTHPEFKVVNDIAATGDDSFYYTNYLYYRNSILHTVEFLTMAYWDDVGYVDGSTHTTVDKGLRSPNGIAVSNDGQWVYVASNNILRFYRRSSINNSLSLEQTFNVNSHLDNIQVDPADGSLYLGTHPIGYVILRHLMDPSHKSPSQVLHVKLENGRASSITELLVDDGSLMSASTVAVMFKKKMLVGTVIDKLVYCDVVVPV